MTPDERRRVMEVVAERRAEERAACEVDEGIERGAATVLGVQFRVLARARADAGHTEDVTVRLAELWMSKVEEPPDWVRRAVRRAEAEAARLEKASRKGKRLEQTEGIRSALLEAGHGHEFNERDMLIELLKYPRERLTKGSMAEKMALDAADCAMNDLIRVDGDVDELTEVDLAALSLVDVSPGDRSTWFTPES